MSEIHEQMLADRYRTEQDFVRGAGVAKCETKNLCIETNAGVGNLTKLYEQHFTRVITNDINPKSIATYNVDSLEFIKTVIPTINEKIDMIDIDAYRCPTPEIKMLFEVLSEIDPPLVVCISDGLGMWMKRSKKVERIKDRFLLDDFQDFDERHPWRQHPLYWNHLMKKLAANRGWKAEPIEIIQTKSKNYVLASYYITK